MYVCLYTCVCICMYIYRESRKEPERERATCRKHPGRERENKMVQMTKQTMKKKQVVAAEWLLDWFFGAENHEKPLLAIPALCRTGLGAARRPGCVPRHEGGRRMGYGVYRILLDPPGIGRLPVCFRAPVGRRRYRQSPPYVRRPTRPRRPCRRSALVWRHAIRLPRIPRSAALLR